ncbi:polysaccharide pyruvyl transferase family protein [Oxalobacteraceae bacterium OM1]|nr:polysaccharide pyruvyl transferase family protein [Oxalobacteraceae bacterium OM1]
MMLQDADRAQEAMARRDGTAWAWKELGSQAHAPYCIGRELFPEARMVYRAVGGVELPYRDAVMRVEVLEKLQQADAASVRDHCTAAWLAAQGLHVPVVPDPAVLTAELFGERIAAAPAGAAGARLGRPYVAVQLSDEFDDASALADIAAALNGLVETRGWGIALFLAGTAPWHDDPACQRRLKALLATPHACLLDSTNVWDICALLAGAALYVGSSLHGRIVAMAYGVPRINLVVRRVTAVEAKQTAYAATWDVPGMPGAVTPAELADAIPHALDIDRATLSALAGKLGRKFRHALA